MRIKLTPELEAYCAEHKIRVTDGMELDDAQLAKAREMWSRQHPDKDAAEIELHAIGLVAAQINPDVARVDEPFRTPAVVKRDWKEIAWKIAVLILLLLITIRGHAQIDVIKVQDNAGAAVGSMIAAPTFKAGPNCTWAKAASTYTFNCAGGAAGAGGSNTQVQWNSTGSLAGISTLTTDGTIVTQKVGTNLLFADPTDATKKIQFDASGVSSATTRTVAFPDANSRTIKNGTTTGQIPIWNAGTSTFDVSDPLVQGTTAEGAAIPNPVVVGGKDGSGNNKALVLDSSGRPTVNVNGTVAVSLASAPTTAVTIADAADVTLGAKADAKSTATDTTAVSIMQVLKEISAMEQAPASRAVTNAGTFAVQATLQANSGVDIGKLTANQSVNQAQIGGTAVVADPCQANAKVYLPISLTSSTQIVSGTSAKKIYICSLNLISAAADNIALVEGTGSVCATGIAGMAGGTTAATGWNFAANGGMTLGSGTGAVIAEATNADNMCLLVSGATQVSGSIAYVVQ